MFWAGSLTTWQTALGRRPAPRMMAARALDCSSPTTSGTVTSSGPVEIVIVTVDPWGASVPAEGLWARQALLRRGVARRLGDRDLEAGVLELGPRARLGLAEHVGNPDLPDALGDAHLDLGALVDLLARRGILGGDLADGFCEKTSTRRGSRLASLRASTASS